MPVVIVPLLFFVPESPRWLAAKDRGEQALGVLARINNLPEQSPEVQLQYQEIVESLEASPMVARGAASSPQTVNTLRSMVSKPNRKRLALALSVAPLAMLTGSNVVT